MTNRTLRLGLREPDIDTQRPLVEGLVKIDGFDLEISRFTDSDRVDAWDAAFGGLIAAKAKGPYPFVSIPAFPNRKFRQSYVFVNRRAGIRTPGDLEGKRVALAGLAITAGIWVRGALQDYYGVDLTRIRWLVAGKDLAGWAPGITVESLPVADQERDRVFDEMLVAGDVDAVVTPNVLRSITRRDAAVARLFPNYRDEEQLYFKETGIFPISHVVTLTEDFVARNPDAPRALLDAYRRARDIARARILGSDPAIVSLIWAAAALEEQRAIMGENDWPYDIAGNVATLKAAMRYAHRFGLTRSVLDYRAFFDASLLSEADTPNAL